jgi:hypothetical protein
MNISEAVKRALLGDEKLVFRENGQLFAKWDSLRFKVGGTEIQLLYNDVLVGTIPVNSGGLLTDNKILITGIDGRSELKIS